jgi:hypothetical protein
MSTSLTHTGAIARGLAYAPAVTPTPRAAPAAAVKPVNFAANAGERGTDQLSLYRMSSIERIRAETAMIADTARRDLAARNQQRAEMRGLGTFIDLRV